MSQSSDARLGLMSGLAAYVLWGLLPVYFHFLLSVSPDLMLAHRIAWSLPTGILLVLAARRWSETLKVMMDWRKLRYLALSGMLIGVNWLVYIWAVHQERVMEASLGYYINPLLNFLVAAMLFGERFNRLQMVAMVLAALGVVNQTVNVGAFPWVAMVLCLTFGAYSVIRRQVQVDSRVGFLMEVLLLAPLALAWLWRTGASGASIWPATSLELTLLVAAGAVTAAPLILFALAAKRLRFSTIGMMQFIGPSLQFVLALAYGEAFTPAHAVTFMLIWVGVGVFSFAAWRADRKVRRAAALA